jgi:hypothetical protein
MPDHPKFTPETGAQETKMNSKGKEPDFRPFDDEFMGHQPSRRRRRKRATFPWFS